jgi:apolipoprotein N-acyltransferase
VAWLQRRRAASVPAIASLWVVLEWGFPALLPWPLGVTLTAAPRLRQAADLMGSYGLSFVIVLVNALIVQAVLRRNVSPRASLRPLAAAAGLLLAMAGYGELRLAQAARSPAAQAGLRVAVVQGNLPSGAADIERANEQAWEVYSALSRDREARSADVILWPETTLRVHLQENPVYRQRVQELSEELGTVLLLGALDRPARGEGELNAAYLVQPKAALHERVGPWQVYHKLRLLPFGEYVPGDSLLPFLAHWRTTGEFVPGDTARPLQLALSWPGREERAGPVHAVAASESSRRDWFTWQGKAEERPVQLLAPSICFEAMWPGAANGMVRQGGAVLVNLTDDGWFGTAVAAEQHLAAVVLRAVESRRYLVRASNSGISAVIDPTGEVVAALPYGAAGVVAQEVAAASILSPYVRTGNWMVVLCFLSLGFAVVRRRAKAAPDHAGLSHRVIESFGARTHHGRLVCVDPRSPPPDAFVHEHFC